MSISQVNYREFPSGNGELFLTSLSNEPTCLSTFYEALQLISNFFHLVNNSCGAQKSYTLIGGSHFRDVISTILQSKKIQMVIVKHLPPISKKRIQSAANPVLNFWVNRTPFDPINLTLNIVAESLNWIETLKQRENLDLLLTLINRHPNLAQEVTQTGWTFLCIVLSSITEHNHKIFQIIRKLINQTPAELIDAAPETALQLYCQLKNAPIDICMLLIKKGANPLRLGMELFVHPAKNQAVEFLQTRVDNSRYLPQTGILPTFDELYRAHKNPVLAYNFYWANQAVFFVSREGVIGPRNCVENIEKTGGWAVTHGDKLHAEYTKFANENPFLSPTAYHFKRAELHQKYRGGGDCFYQSSSAFVYLLKRNINVEYYQMFEPSTGDLAIHQFLVIGRNPASLENHPITWGENAVICDPFERSVYSAFLYYLMPKKYPAIRSGIPIRKLDPAETADYCKKIKA